MTLQADWPDVLRGEAGLVGGVLAEYPDVTVVEPLSPVGIRMLSILNTSVSRDSSAFGSTDFGAEALALVDRALFADVSSVALDV